MARLFDSIQLGGLALPNRIMISPMCQYSAVEGQPTGWHMAHLSSLALSGAGLLCLEATAVTPEGRITPGCLGLWSDDHALGLRRILEVIRASSPVRIAIQLAHAGRKASSDAPWNGGGLLAPSAGGWVAEAPSALAHSSDEVSPRAMDHADLARVRQAFVDAALRAVELGIEAIELHAAHGYLLHQFLSPLANQRTDEYGGSLENRMRYPLEIMDAVRQAVPEQIPVGVRVSATDWFEGGPSWDLEQTIIFAQALQRSGAAWIDVSSGGVTPLQQITAGPGYQLAFAQAVRQQVEVPVIAVGMITEPAQADQIIVTGQADMVALGRAFMLDPRWPWRAAAVLGAQVDGPPQYWRALPAGTPRIFGDTRHGQR